MNLSEYVYRSGKNGFPLFFFAYRNICNKVLAEAVRDVDKQVESLRDKHLLGRAPHWINPKFSSLAQKTILQAKRAYDWPSKKKLILISRVVELTGLTYEEQIACIGKAGQTAVFHLSSLERPFLANNWEIIRKSWKRSLELDRDKTLENLGVKKISEGIPLFHYDRSFLGLSKKDSSNFDELDPAGYVFLKLKEPNMQYYCKFQSLNLDLYFGNSLKTLQSWGYRPVKKPRRGDIAAYISGNVELDQCLFRHYGIYLGKGMVQSKYGRYSYSGIYKHNVFKIPLDYGLNVVFFSKVKR